MGHGGWGCPHEEDGHCCLVKKQPCNPGMKGCVLAGRFLFSDEEKNISRRLKNKPHKTKSS